ncbi:MAG: hypothetical protein AB1416_07420 [Actinomycetota bacterium]
MSSPPAAAVAAPPRAQLATPLVARAAAAAALTPLLGYWVPVRLFEYLVESTALMGAMAAVFLLIPSMIAGAWLAVVAGMRAGRPVGAAAPLVPAIEELLAALLGLVAPNLPMWFGVAPSEGVAQPLVIQAIAVLLALLVMGGVLGDSRLLPPIQVGPIRPPRELTVRAMVAALMPTALLSALLPVVLVSSDLVALLEGDTSSLERRILVAWTSATLLGVAIGMGAWRDGRPPFLERPEQVVIAAAGMALAVAAWFLGGGLGAQPVVFLLQPVTIFVATVVLGTRRDRRHAELFGTRSAAARHDEALLVPPGGAIPLGTRELVHVDAATGAREVRVEARWLVPRAMALVADEYRGRSRLVVRRETDREVLMSRPAPFPAAVRVVAVASPPAAPDAPPPRPRTEVTVRLVRPD